MSHFNTPLQMYLSLYLIPPRTSPYFLKCFVSFSLKDSAVSGRSIFLAAPLNLLISPSFGAQGPAPARALLPKPLEGSFAGPLPGPPQSRLSQVDLNSQTPTSLHPSCPHPGQHHFSTDIPLPTALSSPGLPPYESSPHYWHKVVFTMPR